jgi:tRNA threonylcarbamoyladenosine modification (KEOPS) complex Cgi121 subunit
MAEFEIPGGVFRVYCFTVIPAVEEVIGFLKKSQPPVCLLDAKTVVSPLQLQVAVWNAVAMQRQDKMEAKTIYLEILRCMSPDARLGGAFKHLAVGSTTTAAVAVTFEDAIPVIPGLGSPVPIDEFFAAPKVDLELVRQIYQVTDEMLQTFTYEQIVATTLTIAASDLIRTHAL